MDTDPKTAPLPAKLRWRPYANGTSKKNSTKIKKVDTPNPNAIAHKIRPNQYYSSKSNNAPVKVSLQWEEAETVESMSHGGHPHNLQHQHRSFDSASSRGSSPGAVSDTSSLSSPIKQRAFSTSSASSTGSNNNYNNYNNSNGNVLTISMDRAMASLPSPPPSKPLSSGLDLVGGPTDFNFFKASIPGLTGNNAGQQALGPDSMTPNNAYQIALNVLFQSQTIKHSAFHTVALMDAPLTSSNNNNSNTSASSAASLLGSSTIHDALLSDPNRVLSNEELLGVSSIDELLASCGVMDDGSIALTTQVLSTPTDTNPSYNTTPLNSLMDFNNSGMVVRAPSTSGSNTFSPMAITNQSLEALLAQSVIPQQLPHSHQQQQTPVSPVSTTTTSSPAIVDAYGNLVQALASPFSYLSASDSFTASAPTAWPSLFPTFVEDSSMAMDVTTSTVTASTPQRSEMATQTEGPYVAPLSPQSAASATHGSQRGTPSPLSTALGLSDEEIDPDWLSFLDEASPLFDEADMPSPPPSGDEGNPYPQAAAPRSTEQRTRSTWGWGSAVPPAGHRGLPSTSSMTGIPGGSIGGGGLVRTLQGVGQQRTAKSSKTPGSTPVGAAPSTENDEAKSRTTTDNKGIAPSDLSLAPSEKITIQSEDSWAGLIHMIKGLWSGGGGDSNTD
ncbi:hypothetical protein EC957_002987 [Mortierella hygrophila]|uniref:Uncharacterized protein n=1 Tax=Mortierella hygrophila TaxID=979708 RepID=A0A9P6F3I4_9FUNG|nr:hypothetical protein EC957_002987 [Mortierella hygrophila]